MAYNPAAWFWLVATATAGTAWSSARATYVPFNDPVYAAFVLAGNRPTRIDSDASLQAVLAAQYPAGWVAQTARFTSLEFMALFTAPEQLAIATAALANPAMLIWFLKAIGATYVDMGDPQTTAGLAAMVVAGILTAARETAILASPAPAS